MVMYVNGTGGTSYNISTNSIGTSSETLKLGGLSGSPEGYNDLNGYMKGIRVTKGVARYTSNFTVPTGPFPTV